MDRHFTATVYIIDQDKVLLHPHEKLQKWLPPGGHVELNESPSECAKREAKEETGLDVELIQEENMWITSYQAKSIERPFACFIQKIPSYKNEPPHEHIDMTYIGKAIGGIPFPNMKWFTLEEVETLNENEIFEDTKSIIRHIFSSFVVKNPVS